MLLSKKQLPPSANAVASYRRRTRLLLAAIFAAALLSCGGLVGALWIRSPAQQAADAAPPAPTVLTAAVTSQIVSKAVVLRGTVTATNTQQVTLAPQTQGSQPVVTRSFSAVGSAVSAGHIMAEISGRPLVALPGTIPAYRDLRPGDTGADVAQLQIALSSLGFSHGADKSGTFGEGTKSAVSGYYQHLGYDVPTTDQSGDGADTTMVDAAQDVVTQAKRKLADLRRQMASGADQTPAGGDANEPLQVQISYATQDLVTAQQRYADLVAHNGPMVPLAEVVFLPAFPAYVVATNVVIGQPVKNPLLTMANGSPVVAGRLDPTDSSLVRQGMAVDIDAEATGFSDSGTVASLGMLTAVPASADSTQSAPDSQVYLPVTVSATAPIPIDLIGQDVRLTITSASTGQPALAVPEAALTVTATGETSVVRLGFNDQKTVVAVNAGISGNGIVAVVPRRPTELKVGDKVVTGQ